MLSGAGVQSSHPAGVIGIINSTVSQQLTDPTQLLSNETVIRKRKVRITFAINNTKQSSERVVTFKVMLISF